MMHPIRAPAVLVPAGFVSHRRNDFRNRFQPIRQRSTDGAAQTRSIFDVALPRAPAVEVSLAPAGSTDAAGASFS